VHPGRVRAIRGVPLSPAGRRIGEKGPAGQNITCIQEIFGGRLLDWRKEFNCR
jgi:hypothetical protein